MQEIGEYLFIVLIVLAIGFILIIFPLWLILTVFTPKSLMESYFKEPHFTMGETIMLAQYPGSFFRTVIFAWTLVLLPFGLNSFRKLDNMRETMPAWYAFALRFFIYYTVVTLILTLILFAVLFGIKYYAGL